MLLKTSFFNGTVLRKNLTRYAPVWMGYAICLVIGLGLLYADAQASYRSYYFSTRLMETVQLTGAANLIYAPIVAQLLFGDLYNSRICNMMHAFPLRREGWYLTNIASGLLFSLIPTAIMSLAAMVLLIPSVFDNAMMLAVYLFLGANLQFLTYFGMAVFAAHCTGNRFTMAAGYCLLAFGALLAYCLIDSVYTPMLTGVVTPSLWAEKMSPFMEYCSTSFLTAVESINDLIGVGKPDSLEGLTAHYSVDWEMLGQYGIYAAVGLAFILAALVLYQKRHLERAGDAVAFPWLEPVFAVLCTCTVAVVAYMGVNNVLGFGKVSWILWLGLVLGWIIALMLIERSTRVFKLKNFRGLAALLLAFGLSLGLTRFDVLGIASRVPDPEDIAKYSFSYNLTTEVPEGDEALLLRLHQLCIDNALDPEEYTSNSYIQNGDGQWVPRYEYLSTWPTDESGEYIGDPPEYRSTDTVYISYELTNGHRMQRRYTIWADSEMGDIVRRMDSHWEVLALTAGNVYEDNVQVNALDYVLDQFNVMSVDAPNHLTPYEIKDKDTALSFLEAVKKDCAEGTMAQNYVYHTGYIICKNYYTQEAYTNRGVYVTLEGGTRSRGYAWSIQVFPDSRHTIQWLQDHDLLDGELVQGVKKPLW